MEELAPSTQTGSTAEAPPALLRDWALCAVVAAGARFVPVPLLDGVIQGRANRLVVGRSLKAAGVDTPVTHLAPLYDTGSWLGFLLSLPLAVVLYPIRKIVSVISAVKGVPSDLLETLLLGRTVYRCAGLGMLDHDDAGAAKAEAKAVRAAFDAALKESNLKVLSSALGEALSHLKNLGALTADLTRALLDRSEDDVGDDVLDHLRPKATGDSLERPTGSDGQTAPSASGRFEAEAEAATEIESALGRSDVKAELAAFDERFDAALGRRRTQSPTGVRASMKTGDEP